MHPSTSNIRERLRIARLPSMPQILLKLLELCQAEDVSLEELAKLIETDAGMCAKVLGVANSAAYYRGGQKVQLLQALALLGSDLVRSLVISESIFQTFSGLFQSPDVDLRHFWKHSLLTAISAKEIARTMGYPHLEEAYLAGLLHDVGRLALMATVPAQYGELLACADDDQLCNAEEARLAVTHTDAGALLVERWGMDSFIADSVLFHHEPAALNASSAPLVRIVRLAQELSALTPEALQQGAAPGGPLSLADLQRICRESGHQVMQAADMLGIDLKGLDQVPGSASALPARGAPTAAYRSGGGADPAHQLGGGVAEMTALSEAGLTLSKQTTDEQVLGMFKGLVHMHLAVDEAALFMLNGNGNSLVCVEPGEKLQRLTELTIAVGSRSAISTVVAQGKATVLSLGGPTLEIAEQQLLRMLGGQSMLCLPLTSAGQCWGLLIAGIPSHRMAEVTLRTRFLEALAASAARCLANLRRDRSQIDQRIAALRSAFLARSRRMTHEVNNPLGIIRNYLGVMDSKLVRQEPVAEELQILREELDRVGNIVNDFSNPRQQPETGVSDINQIVRDLVRLFASSKFLPASVSISTQLPEGRSEVACSADLLKQVLINLMKNAVEAMAQGGQLEISNRGRALLGNRPCLVLTVADTGPGISEDMLSKLFSQVRSSKPGVNRGIGLSIVHGLIQRVGGEISCRSGREGAVFELKLPLAEASVLASKPVVV